MPSKKRKKKKKTQDQPQENLLDFDLYFDDLTMLEADGAYSRVCEIMEADVKPIVVIKRGSPLVLKPQSVSGNEWCIKSNLTIFSPFGQGNLTLDFYNDGRVFIVGFASTNMSTSQNMDVRCVSSWCQGNDWNVPQVAPQLARDNLKFWKHWWESLIIDSDYFDERFGKRRALDMRNLAVDPEEDADEVAVEKNDDVS